MASVDAIRRLCSAKGIMLEIPRLAHANWEEKANITRVKHAEAEEEATLWLRIVETLSD
jgi:hypothetical protein